MKVLVLYAGVGYARLRCGGELEVLGFHRNYDRSTLRRTKRYWHLVKHCGLRTRTLTFGRALVEQGSAIFGQFPFPDTEESPLSVHVVSNRRSASFHPLLKWQKSPLSAYMQFPTGAAPHFTHSENGRGETESKVKRAQQ